MFIVCDVFYVFRPTNKINSKDGLVLISGKHKIIGYDRLTDPWKFGFKEIQHPPSQYGGYDPRPVTEWVRVPNKGNVVFSSGKEVGLSPVMDSCLECYMHVSYV
ncbi:hypothetical protein TNCV_2329551 [Trichonephila clavipes]|nr:hypothetical protein TNCV_2329551 [Trichonephila clavipes]